MDSEQRIANGKQFGWSGSCPTESGQNGKAKAIAEPNLSANFGSEGETGKRRSGEAEKRESKEICAITLPICPDGSQTTIACEE